LLIIPAVDISKGKCVRLFMGRIEECKVYYDNPLEAIRKWEEEGAELLHIVDLDAAIGIGSNKEIIKKILKESKIPIQIGGGIRNLEIAQEYLESGAYRIIFGTVALELRTIKEAIDKFGSEKIMVAIDHAMGRVAIKGWKEILELDAEILCRNLFSLGVKKFLMTSIDRNGTLKGPNISYSLMVASKIPAEFYLAGGFSRIEEIIPLKGKIAGVIIGKALYEGKIDFKKAKEVLKYVN